MLSQMIKESACLFIALGIGLYTFARLSLFYRVIFLQTAFATIIYIAARMITEYQALHGLPRDNQWVYNVYILGESLLLLYAAGLWLNDKKATVLIVVGFTCTLIVFAYHAFTVGPHRFANTTQIMAGIVIITAYILILYRALNTPDFKHKLSPDLWLVIGLCIYFACNVPFMGFIHYLYAQSPEMAETLFRFITNVLGNIRYLLAGLSFWLFFRRQTLISNNA